MPFRPEAEGRLALPHHEFALGVVARVGQLRYAEHRSVPDIHAHLTQPGVALAERTVTNLLDRYDELSAVALADDDRLHAILQTRGRVVLAIDGLQPDVGHEVLWVLRDVLSGEILLAKSLLSARNQDLAALLEQVRANCPVPIAGDVRDRCGDDRRGRDHARQLHRRGQAIRPRRCSRARRAGFGRAPGIGGGVEPAPRT